MYVGITRGRLETRLGQHRRSKKSLISKAIAKYGSMHATVIAECATYEELVVLEQMAISFFRSKNPSGYNQTDGGEGLLGLTHSESARRKISANTKNNTERRRLDSVLSNMRRTISDETRARQSRSMHSFYSANPCPETLREIRRKNQTGRTATDATRKAISESQLRMSDTTRSHISNSTRIANASRNWSFVSRCRLSVSRAIYFANSAGRPYSTYDPKSCV